MKNPELNIAAAIAMHHAKYEAKSYRFSEITTEHILYGLTLLNPSKELLSSQGIRPEKIRKRIKKNNALNDPVTPTDHLDSESDRIMRNASIHAYLYGREITAEDLLREITAFRSCRGAKVIESCGGNISQLGLNVELVSFGQNIT